MRRLGLGLFLIASVSGVLLVSDLQQRQSRKTSGNMFNVQLVELNNVLDVEDTERGILDGLQQAGFVKGRNYGITIRNAQGDMATLNGLVDAALADRPDILVTLSSPALQAALRRSQGKVPIVFAYVASAIAAGAGTSNEDHLPNVTGVPMVAPFEEMLEVIRKCLPHARRLGTLFVPAEVNMVFSKDELVKAAKKAGFEVVAVGVATSSEVPDAALALMGQGIDALCQVPGNMTAASFGGIANSARRARIPVFAFQQAQAREGASVVLAREYYGAGREASAMAIRILRGESPAAIPFHPYEKATLIVHPGAARAVGMTIAPDVLSKAAEVIQD